MSNLIRFISMLALATALVFGATGIAGAQDTYAPVFPLIEPLPLPGPFGSAPANLSGTPGASTGQTANARLFQASPSLTPATATGSASAATGGAGGTGGGNALAFTGADSATLAAGGMALVLVGGAAVIASRKRS